MGTGGKCGEKRISESRSLRGTPQMMAQEVLLPWWALRKITGVTVVYSGKEWGFDKMEEKWEKTHSKCAGLPPSTPRTWLKKKIKALPGHVGSLVTVS